MESDRIHARAAIMREAVNSEDAPSAERGWLDWLLDCGVPGITGVDTRALVRHIRDAGAMLGGVFPGAMGEDEARALIAAEPPMTGRDLAREVTPREPHVVEGDGSGPRIVALDTGIKTSIVRNFVAARRDARAAAVHDARRRGAARAGRTASSSCPDPATPRRSATSSRPCARRSGGCRCSGSASATRSSPRRSGSRRSSCRSATAAATTRSRTCAPGGSRSPPQNHGFAVRGEAGQRLQTDFGEAELTHVNLYDGTIEGLRLLDVPAGCVQYHPEAGPGPHDSVGLFDEFIGEISNARPDAGLPHQDAVRMTGGGTTHA